VRRGGLVLPCDWTEAEVSRLREVYATPPPLRLAALAEELGRNKANVCRKARALGLTDQARAKVLERKPQKSPLFHSIEELRAHQSAVTKARIAEKGHPRGALGMRHSAEAKARVAEANRKAWADPSSGHNTPESRQRRSDQMVARIQSGDMRSKYSRSAGGKRSDLGDRYFRSAWEANYARYLNWRVTRGDLAAWEYETKTFVFEKIKRGTRAYTPDFKLVFADGRHEWHEVKGWMDPKSATRIKRMAKYFPQEALRIIDEKWFRQAKATGLASIIVGWESRGRGSRGC